MTFCSSFSALFHFPNYLALIVRPGYWPCFIVSIWYQYGHFSSFFYFATNRFHIGASFYCWYNSNLFYEIWKSILIAFTYMPMRGILLWSMFLCCYNGHFHEGRCRHARHYDKNWSNATWHCPLPATYLNALIEPVTSSPFHHQHGSVCHLHPFNFPCIKSTRLRIHLHLEK